MKKKQKISKTKLLIKKINIFEFKVLPWVLVVISLGFNILLYSGLKQENQALNNIKQTNQELLKTIEKNNQKQSKNTLNTLELEKNLPPSKQQTIPHEFLPGFDLNYSADWNLKFKQFREKDSGIFKSNYLLLGCDETCMGIKISKGSIGIDLLFVRALDNNSLKCSNQVETRKISDKWYRIKDSSGIFYAPKARVELNKTLEYQKFPSSFGTTQDEWSAVENETYNICLQGSGEFLENFSPAFSDGGILMEFPRIVGDPTNDQLEEINSTINSIEGLKEYD